MGVTKKDNFEQINEFSPGGVTYPQLLASYPQG